MARPAASSRRSSTRSAAPAGASAGPSSGYVIPGGVGYAYLDERPGRDEDNPDKELPDWGVHSLRSGGSRGPRQRRKIDAFCGMGASHCLAEMLAAESEGIAARVFILDNSGSTAYPDGHLLLKEGVHGYSSIQSTRWEEIASSAMAQAEWNAASGVRCMFVLVNPPCPDAPVEGRDYCTIDPAKGPVDEQVQALSAMLRENGPRGTTPIAQRLRELRQRIQEDLAAKPDGRWYALSILTDGLPTSAYSGQCTQRDKDELVAELRCFANAIRCFIVIRLCTDEDEVVDYYNRIDEEVELPLDILDDLCGEAKETKESGNGWFAYTPLLHRIREGGTRDNLFDLLDERRFTPVEMATFLEYLLRGPDDPPFPRQPQRLLDHVRAVLPLAPQVYDGRRDRMGPPVHISQLQAALGLTRMARIRSGPGRMWHAMRRMMAG